MIKFLTFCILITSFLYSQQSSFDLHSVNNIKKFADHLFCEGDYLRAIEQYGLIPANLINDTLNFKIMMGYSKLNLHDEAIERFSNKYFPSFTEDAQLLYLKNSFLHNSIDFHNSVSNNRFPFEMELEVANYFLKLRSIYYIENRIDVIDKKDLLKPFDFIQRAELEYFYELNINPGYKSPVLAGVLSAVIPGSGKMYVGEWGDGITALLATGLFAFLAYDNFKADHKTRAWIFTGLGAFFYAGNIYGSVASAQIFNAKIDFEFQNGLKLYLQQQDYFLPDYDFCK